MFIVLIAWVAIWGSLGYFIGNGKGRGDEGAALGCVLGPIGILFAIYLRDKRRRCQFCREPVALEATTCSHCQKEIAPACNVVCTTCGHGFNLTPAALGHVARCPACKRMTPTKKPVTAGPGPGFVPAFGQDRVDKAAPLQ